MDSARAARWRSSWDPGFRRVWQRLDPEDEGLQQKQRRPVGSQWPGQSKTGALEGPEVDGFVKDMMELVQPSVRGADLERLRESLLRHCDANRDGKVQKAELGLCLGLRSSP